MYMYMYVQLPIVGVSAKKEDIPSPLPFDAYDCSPIQDGGCVRVYTV